MDETTIRDVVIDYAVERGAKKMSPANEWYKINKDGSFVNFWCLDDRLSGLDRFGNKFGFYYADPLLFTVFDNLLERGVVHG